MAILEKVCWEILNKLKGSTCIINKGKENSRTIENAMSLYEIEKDLVLRYSKSEIEDSLYFLEKRGYLILHGFMNLTLVAYELTVRAFEVLNENKFSDEEQKAFQEALFDIKKPGWFGMKVNLGEIYRRFKKRFMSE